MDQEKIWDYFQNERPDTFAGSVVRLQFLFQKAWQLSHGRPLKVLNIGVGSGWLETRCAGVGWETFSLDPNEKAISRLAERNIVGKVGFIEQIPFESGSFDVVFCSEVLEHLTKDQLTSGLREAARVLMPGGHLIGSVPYNENIEENVAVCPDCGKVFHRWGHVRSFDRPGLQRLLESSGFRLVEAGTRAFIGFSDGTMKNRIGRLLHLFLGRVGSPLGIPSLYFVAKLSE